VIIRNERDVRKRVKDMLKEAGIERRAVWCEPRWGGTYGIPDLLLIRKSGFLPIELKAAEGSDLLELCKAVSLTKNQRKIWRRFFEYNCEFFVVCGQIGTNLLWSLDPWAICPDISKGYQKKEGNIYTNSNSTLFQVSQLRE